ncbi:MAG: ABC transporter substrate-binding protein [Deltaproteobacteria bacterium]|nr:ABC transporter substrate-binding protein [Deltaproteobacteria bacterium]
MLALLLTILCAPASSEPSFAATYLGTVRPSGSPKRIVSVAPSTTELLFALGAGPRVVGVSRFDDFPPEVSKVQKVGGFLDPSVETIVGLGPELVVAVPNASNRPSLERIAELGIPVLVVPGNSFEDVGHAARALGEALGAAGVKRSEDLMRSVLASVRAIEARSKARGRLRAAFVYDANPLVLAGPGSFAHTLLEILNLDDVVKIADAYPKYSYEKLVADAPEIVFDASHIASDELRRRLLSTPAGKAGRIVRLDDSSLLRAGPRIGAALELLEKSIAMSPEGARPP